MSQSNLQLLLHAGELEYIVNTIKKSKQTEFVGGCLFGLWRNSLKQPVIQFVTGSGPQEKYGQHSTIEDVFKSPYVKPYADILEEDHRLSHLGFWFYVSKDNQEEGICDSIILFEGKAWPQVAYAVITLLYIQYYTHTVG
jgi:hypothetical protein